MNTRINDYYLQSVESDKIIDQLLSENDDSFMPLPAIEYEPHLLISKVRKHYMEYVINLLSVNYENNQRLLNKNIYIPSAIWRCAKIIETKAAQDSMVVQLYRNNILAVIKELKNDTKRGKLNKLLSKCLTRFPENEKKVQTNFPVSNDCNCQCTCTPRKKRRKSTESFKPFENNMTLNVKQEKQYSEPIFIIEDDSPRPYTNGSVTINSVQNIQESISISESNVLPQKSKQVSAEPKSSDELMLQLEKLFQCDSQEDDLFEGTCFEGLEQNDDINKKTENEVQSTVAPDSVIENHAAQIKSLDERLASLAGLIVNNDTNTSQEKMETPKCNRKPSNSKWLCEEYFLKCKLFELLDQIGDVNRKKLARIKHNLYDLFGEDSDEEGVMSPLDETPEFVISCKERIAPWVVKLLTPFYIMGRIKSKVLFKALAKHLLRIIYQCSRYPNEYEVHSFVSDFLQHHKTIRCEADFKQFRIENL